MSEGARTPLWVRAVADPAFRDELIADPLGALAAHPDVEASGEQVRQLDALGAAERRDIVDEVVREVYRRRGPTSGKDYDVR